MLDKGTRTGHKAVINSFDVESWIDTCIAKSEHRIAHFKVQHSFFPTLASTGFLPFGFPSALPSVQSYAMRTKEASEFSRV